MNSQPHFEVVRDSPAAAVVDADGALGIHVGAFAMRMAVAPAKTSGWSTSFLMRTQGESASCSSSSICCE